MLNKQKKVEQGRGTPSDSTRGIYNRHILRTYIQQTYYMIFNEFMHTS